MVIAEAVDDVEVMIADNCNERNCKVFLHLVKQIPILSSLTAPYQVTDADNEGDIHSMVYVTQERFKDRTVPFVVPKYGEGEVSRIRNLDPRDLLFVPIVDSQWRIVFPELNAYEHHDAKREENYLDGVLS